MMFIHFYDRFFCFSYFITTFTTVMLIIILKVMSRVTTSPGINFYDSFLYHDVNIFNISYTNVLYSSDNFYPYSLYFCKYSFLIYSVFNDIFYVNNITNIFDNNCA